MVSDLKLLFNMRLHEDMLTNDFILKVADVYPQYVIWSLINEPKYLDICMEIIKTNYDLISVNGVDEVLFRYEKSVNFIFSNLSDILQTLKDRKPFLQILVNYIGHNNKDLYNLIAYLDDMEIRAEIMFYLSIQDRDYFQVLYPNITDYFVVKDESGNIISKMKEEDLSRIAVNLFDCVMDKELFSSIKEFIFNNYSKNHLLSLMAEIDTKYGYNGDIFHVHEEIVNDFERLFLSSMDYKMEALEKYPDLVPKKYYQELNQIKQYFTKQRCFELVDLMFKKGMGEDFVHLINKYASISENPIIAYNGSGTASDIFIAGDFVVKHIERVYHIGPIKERYYPCFLVNKVLEEKYYYDEAGRLLGILQVQQKLNKPLKRTDYSVQKFFKQELDKLGYFIGDDLVRGTDSNCFYLNDYRDADIKNLCDLPEWFKEAPLVLVDLDLMYTNEQREKLGFKK